MTQPRNVRIYVSEADLPAKYQEWDQRYQNIHHRIPVRSAKEMVNGVLSVLQPGQYIEYLYIDGHGGTHGMDIGPQEGLSPTAIHEVHAGETLWSLASRYYGNPSRWQLIYDRNRPRIGTDPDRIQVGTKLIIPKLVPIADVQELRRLRSRFAAGATVFLGGCQVGQNKDLIQQLSQLWGVHVRAGLGNQVGLWPGTEGGA
jgi:LysM repeat protein